MGKSLIIKGADFSRVAVSGGQYEWIINRYSDSKNTGTAQPNTGGFIPGDSTLLQGRTINCIKLMVKTPGQMTIAVSDGTGANVSFSQQRVLSFPPDTINTAVIKHFEDITVPSNGYICICIKTTDSLAFGYTNRDTNGAGFYNFVGKQNATGELKGAGALDLNFSFGYYSEQTV